MYHIDYSWKNLKENAPSWLSLKDVIGWTPWLLLFVLVWIGLGQFLAFWPQLFAYLTIGAITFFVREELVENRNKLRQILSIVESREEKGDREGFNRVLSAIDQLKENIMAIGKETQAALADLNEAIVVETEQAARKIIEATNADAATADAIREALAGVRNIVPDEVEEPVEEPVDPVDPVDPEAPADPEEA